MRKRAIVAVAVAALFSAACTNDAEQLLEEAEAGQPSEAGESAATPEPLIDTDDLISGGPPPDGIPPIDAPKFQPVDEVDWLVDDDPVLSLQIEDEAKAYPLQVMTWHEIVNDTVGGVPVAVTYCPLCNSGVAFERVVDGERYDFGTSGLLYADNLVMYDRQTRSLWPQLTGLASVGELTGTQLTAIPLGVTGFAQFREAFPQGKVLTRDTGFERPYGENPYAGYDDPDGSLLFDLPDGEDPRLPVKERVIGVEIDGDALAVRRQTVADRQVMEVEVGGQELVLWHTPGQRSALDTSAIAQGRDVGTVGVYDPQVDDRRLTFEPAGGGFRDDQTGSRWNVLGVATSGPLAGTQLTPVTHLDTFWFSWVAFKPDTALTE
ncbi:DUF3179 domain-containing protein [Nocardioides coralli]|uniref:DUF3179 domain-containing protein n=1 Tax=Nocardioides coralli TaxID=2872154 RepID=UPI001CA420CE|nr:DUF3179 domain-containing protein [Nocardioides coralli]QZY29124.1 DUF3179 domain-containing protein [Nocardioides coralli]